MSQVLLFLLLRIQCTQTKVKECNVEKFWVYGAAEKSMACKEMYYFNLKSNEKGRLLVIVSHTKGLRFIEVTNDCPKKIPERGDA